LPGAPMTYSISGGADSDLFIIDAHTGALTFKNAPNFESPADAGGNNVYDVTVTAMDERGRTDSQALSVLVTDVNEAPVAGIPVAAEITEGHMTPLSFNLLQNVTDPDANSILSVRYGSMTFL